MPIAEKHLSLDELNEYASRKIIGHRVARIEGNVATCPDCATILRQEIQIARLVRDAGRQQFSFAHR